MRCTVVVPCRNEAHTIRRCLDSIAANDYPADQYEVVVSDGMSDDGTREVLRDWACGRDNVRIIDNPACTTPAALNRAIRAARGDVIIRVDAHSTVEPDYLRRCVEALERTGADNVGGIMMAHPAHDGPWARAIVAALGHRFGVGNSTFRVHTREPQWVDTVFGGCYRRDLFDRVGFFNERLLRGQDMEFNRRLTAAGGRILLIPEIVSHYYARTDLASFCRHNWGNGVWAILPFIYSEVMPVSWRHLVPMVFVAALVSAAVAAAVWPPALWLLAAILAAYAAAAVAAAVQIALRARDPRLALQMPVVFLLLHGLYGGGSIWGAAKASVSPELWRRLLGAHPASMVNS